MVKGKAEKKVEAASSVASGVQWTYDIILHQSQAPELIQIEILLWQTLWYLQILYHCPTNQYNSLLW